MQVVTCKLRSVIEYPLNHAVAGKLRDAAVNSDWYRFCWHFAGAISTRVPMHTINILTRTKYIHIAYWILLLANWILLLQFALCHL